MNEQNEQDLVKKQIEKREKIDTILAYVLIVILSVCIALLTYLKLTQGKEEKVPQDEHEVTYISLAEAGSLLTASPLAQSYQEDGATFEVVPSNSSLAITYVKGEERKEMEVLVIGSELEVSLTDDTFTTDIFRELATIICKYYGNSESNCRDIVNESTPETPVNGIRYTTDTDATRAYISMTSGVTSTSGAVYEEVTPVDIDATDYTLKINDTKISNIDVTTEVGKLTIKGTIERTSEDSKDLSVVARLYNEQASLIADSKYDYSGENKLEKTGEFTITFTIGDELKLSDIKQYSLSVEK